MDDRYVIPIAFGKGAIPLYANPELASWHLIQSKFEPPLSDAQARFRASCRNPIGSTPLRDMVRPSDHVVIVTSDRTRPVPNRKLIPWILEELPTAAENVTVLLGNGTHRSNTPAEIADMFGEDTSRRVQILNHDAFDPRQNECVGQTANGAK
ncbi:MAG: lactate racemase domain-containing protein, partial [Chloroflexota bacterium]